MRDTIRHLALAAVLAGLPTAASATGNLDCGIDDANLKFDFSALFGHGVVSPLMQGHARFESENPAIAEPLRLFESDGTFLVQQWFEGRDLKLMFYRETEGEGVPFASIKLKIDALQPPDEDFGYVGKYQLVIQPPIKDGETSEPVTLEGDVGCSAG